MCARARARVRVLQNVMGWKQNKMATKGESTGDSTPSTYSPLSRRWPGCQHATTYTVPPHVTSGPASASGLGYAGTKSQYDALPVGTLGTYDPAADEIDYSFYQNARPNRRRLLYSRSPDVDQDEDRAGDAPVAGGRRKHRGRRDWALRGRSGPGVGAGGVDLADGTEEAMMDDAELSTETLYVMLLVLASTAVTMLAAYLILL